MRLHGRLWRRVAIGTLLLLACLPATLAPDTPPIDPARILEQLDGASSELVSDLGPSHSFPSGNPTIPHEDSSSTAFNSAVRQAKPEQLLPPILDRTSDGIDYRIEMQDTTLADDLVRELKSRAATIPVTDKKEKAKQRLAVAALRFKPAGEVWGIFDDPRGKAKLMLERTVQAAAREERDHATPIMRRYRVGDIDYTMRNSHTSLSIKHRDFNVVATFGRDTNAPQYVYLGQLHISKWLVDLSETHWVSSQYIGAAQRAGSETASVEPSQRRRPSLGPVRTLENLQGGPSAPTSDLHPSQSLFPSIAQEGSSSGAISSAVGRKRGRGRRGEGEEEEKGEKRGTGRVFRPPNSFRAVNRMPYRIEMQDDALVDVLLEEIQRRAEGMTPQPSEKLVQDIRFQPTRKFLDPSGQPTPELQMQMSTAVVASSSKDYKAKAPIADKYNVGHVEYFMRGTNAYRIRGFDIFNVVATVRRGTELIDRTFLGRLEIPTDLVQASKEQEQDALSAAQRAAVEPARVDPANIGPGGVGQALQHKEAGLDVEHVRPFVHPNKRPRHDPNERHLLDPNEHFHEHESAEDE